MSGKSKYNASPISHFVCRTCKVDKPIKEFWRALGRPNKHQEVCIDCAGAYHKAWVINCKSKPPLGDGEL